MLHKVGECIPEEIINKSLIKSLRKRMNKKNIKYHMNKYKECLRPFIASIYMDTCIDEEGIDTLVSYKGNPSHYTCDIDTSNCINDMCRNIIRRLYHGARDLPYYILDVVFRNKNKFMSSPIRTNDFRIMNRNISYYNTEKEKLYFWLKYRSKYFTECFEPDLLFYPPELAYYIFNKNSCRVVYTSKYVDTYKWIDLELEFGRYHRTKDLVVSVLLRGVNDENPKGCTLKKNLCNIGYDLSKNIIEFI